MRDAIVIGSGLAGLTAAISCAEQGAAVVLHEAHSTVGGRARSTAAPYIANDGTHAFAHSLDEHNRNVQKYQVQYFRDKRLAAQRDAAAAHAH